MKYIIMLTEEEADAILAEFEAEFEPEVVEAIRDLAKTFVEIEGENDNDSD